MSCKPCQRIFVQVAELLRLLKDGKLSSSAEGKSRALSVSIMVIGEYLTAVEIYAIKGEQK